MICQKGPPEQRPPAGLMAMRVARPTWAICRYHKTKSGRNTAEASSLLTPLRSSNQPNACSFLTNVLRRGPSSPSQSSAQASGVPPAIRFSSRTKSLWFVSGSRASIARARSAVLASNELPPPLPSASLIATIPCLSPATKGWGLGSPYPYLGHRRAIYVAPQRALRLDAVIASLIGVVDAIDGDNDLEPYFAGGPVRMDEAEPDHGDERITACESAERGLATRRSAAMATMKTTTASVR